MNSQQKFTLKYWIFHNKLTVDVYIDTASKNLDECQQKAACKYLNEYMDYMNSFGKKESCYEFSLFEINNCIE